MSRADDILGEADPFYFLDYAVFTGSIRQQATKTLEEAFQRDQNPQNPIHQRLHGFNLLKEEYAAYEDVGAMLDSFLEYRQGDIGVPLARLINYGPGDVVLSRVFERHSITSPEDLYAKLQLDDWIPPKWAEWYPQLDLRKALIFACRFFIECGQTQNRVGVAAYNKIKHGLMIVPSARAYVGTLPDAPAALIATPKELIADGASPFSLAPIDIGETSTQARYAIVEFAQCDLRLLAALYVTRRYPDFLKRRGIDDPQRLFACQEFYDVRNLIAEVTLKKRL